MATLVHVVTTLATAVFEKVGDDVGGVEAAINVEVAEKGAKLRYSLA